MTEDTFVASDVDTSISGSDITLSNSAVSVSGSTITMVDLDAPYSKEMYMLAGGNFSISGSTVLTGDVIRGPWKSGMMVSLCLAFTLAL